MHNEIKRLLRSLDEACKEYGISIDEAVSWFKTSNNSQPIMLPKQKTFKEVAEYTVSMICENNAKQKEICFEVLCLAHEAGENVLLAKDVLNHILDKQLVPLNIVGKNLVKDYVYEFLIKFHLNQGIPNPRRIIGKKNWRSICFALRDLAKTLNPKNPTS